MHQTFDGCTVRFLSTCLTKAQAKWCLIQIEVFKGSEKRAGARSGIRLRGGEYTLQGKWQKYINETSPRLAKDDAKNQHYFSLRTKEKVTSKDRYRDVSL